MSNPPDFDRIAPCYRLIEAVCAGPLMARARRAFLPELSSAGTVLLAGEGPGQFLAELRRSSAPVRITVLDSSERMLAGARRALNRAGGATGEVAFVHGDILKVALPAGHFDAVATHFFLDCFEESDLIRLVDRVSGWASPGALWAVTDFCIPRGLMAVPAKILVRLLYAAFRLTTGLRTRRLVEVGPTLARAGWRRERRRCVAAGFLRADLYRLHGDGGGNAGSV